MQIRSVVQSVGLAACLAVPMGIAFAQSDDTPTTLDAEMKGLADRSLLLDVINVGPRFVAVGERGHVVASKDGVNWVQAEVPTRSVLTAVDFADDSNGWAVGHDSVIIHTADGGQSWSVQNFAPDDELPLLDVTFVDDERGYALGAYSLFLQTSDGGQTWDEVDTPIREEEWHFNGLTELADGTLLLVGESGTLAASVDSGETWQALESPYEGSYFSAVASGDTGAVVFGLRGNAYYVSDLAAGLRDVSDDAEVADDETDAAEDDGGYDDGLGSDIEKIALDWKKLDLQTPQSLQGGTQLSDGSAILVGLNGVIRQVSADGKRVTPVSNPFGSSLANVIAQGGNLLVVGESGAQLIER